MFTKDSFEGINRMIERRPIVNGSESTEQYEAPVKDVVRLNKFIANSGVCSRREADTFIQAGVVTVNGQVVTELGTKVNIHEDDVRFNGERLKGEEKVYIIMNKPKGFVTTASDPHADKTVVDLVSKCPARVYPVGRLDKNTTGPRRTGRRYFQESPSATATRRPTSSNTSTRTTSASSASKSTPERTG